jgi:hypothetical protein
MKENENKPAWMLEIGFYPGLLLGFRSYPEEEYVTHVLYVPFFDLAITVYY